MIKKWLCPRRAAALLLSILWTALLLSGCAMDGAESPPPSESGQPGASQLGENDRPEESGQPGESGPSGAELLLQYATENFLSSATPFTGSDPKSEGSLKQATEAFFFTMRAIDETGSDFDLSPFWDPETEHPESLEIYQGAAQPQGARPYYGSPVWCNLDLEYLDIQFDSDTTAWVYVKVGLHYIAETTEQFQRSPLSYVGRRHVLYFRLVDGVWLITNLEFEDDARPVAPPGVELDFPPGYYIDNPP